MVTHVKSSKRKETKIDHWKIRTICCCVDLTETNEFFFIRPSSSFSSSLFYFILSHSRQQIIINNSSISKCLIPFFQVDCGFCVLNDNDEFLKCVSHSHAHTDRTKKNMTNSNTNGINNRATEKKPWEFKTGVGFIIIIILSKAFSFNLFFRNI